jgi:hypothetical protein
MHILSAPAAAHRVSHRSHPPISCCTSALRHTRSAVDLETSKGALWFRMYATAAARQDGLLLLCGGRSDNGQPLNDAYGLARHRDGRWEWASAPSNMPVGRYQHAAVFVGARLHVSGGSLGGGTMVDKKDSILILDSTAGMWASPVCEGTDDMSKRCRCAPVRRAANMHHRESRAAYYTPALLQCAARPPRFATCKKPWHAGGGIVCVTAAAGCSWHTVSCVSHALPPDIQARRSCCWALHLYSWRSRRLHTALGPSPRG